MRNDLSPSVFERAIRATHECSATFRDVTQVREEFGGKLVWEGSVYVFDVDHPEASTCFAWSFPGEGAAQRICTVLKKPPIATAADAVRASIVADHQNKRA